MGVGVPRKTGSTNLGLVVGVILVIVVGLGVAALLCVGLRSTSVMVVKPTHSATAVKLASAGAQVADQYAGFELVPGVYKAGWELKSACLNERTSCMLSPLPADVRKKLAWRISETAYHGQCDAFDIIIERNNGAFDTAYVIRSNVLLESRGKIGLEHVWRVPLAKTGSGWANEHFPVTVFIGSGSHSLEKKAEIYIKTDPDFGTGAGGMNSVSFDWLGGMFGVVQTSKGLYKMRLIDEDGNGIYSGNPQHKYLCPVCKQYHYGREDSLRIEDVPSGGGLSSSFSENGWPVSGIGMVAGKLYEFDTASDGQRVTIKRYTGPTGSVKVVGSDGFGKPTAFSAAFSGPGSFAVSGYGSRIVQLPPGRYNVESLVKYLDHRPSSGHDEHYDYELQCSFPEIKLSSGGNATVKVGGPMVFEISQPITVKSGSKTQIKIRLKRPSMSSGYVEDYSKPDTQVTIKDSKGTAIRQLSVNLFAKTDHTAPGNPHQTIAKLDVGSLPPGEYEVVVVRKKSEAFEEASAMAKIVVTR